MNYSEIRELALKHNCSANEFYTLSKDNDPFYIGTPGEVRQANWFKEIWEKFGYTDNVHLRRIHYRLVSQKEPVRCVNGSAYINNNDSWRILNRASRYARVLGLVDPAAFVDRRNPVPIINMKKIDDPDPSVFISNSYEDLSFSLPKFPEPPVYSVSGYEADQRYHIEVWAEKTTMNDILEPLCQKHGVNLITGAGHMSITSVRWLFDRLEEYQKPCRIFYVSDFDPSGLSMPVGVARKIEFYAQDDRFDIQLVPLILSHEQCKKYELPRTPLNGTDQRAAKFEDLYGKGVTELDALESLHPGALGKIVSDAILKYRDATLRGRVQDVENNLIWNLGKIRANILSKHADVLEDCKNEYKSLKEEFAFKFENLSDRIASVYRDTQDEMEEEFLSFFLPEVPKAIEVEEDDASLYDSRRDYFEQLKKYKQFQNGHVHRQKDGFNFGTFVPKLGTILQGNRSTQL